MNKVIFFILIGLLPVTVSAQNSLGEAVDLSAIDWANSDSIDWTIFNERNINTIDSKGMTPVAYAAAYGDAEVIDRVLQFNPDINQLTEDGWTPLALAIIAENNESVALLIEKKADINEVFLGVNENEIGFEYTPLSVAVNSKNVVATTLLLENGADVEDGFSPFGLHLQIPETASPKMAALQLINIWGTYTQKLATREITAGNSYGVYENQGKINIEPIY